MKSLASRIAALEKRQKIAGKKEDEHRETKFFRDGQLWIRYSYANSAFDFELPSNGRDDPLGDIWSRVAAGESRPDSLSEQEAETWDCALMDKIGLEMIRRLHAGEIDRAALTPQELDCVELVEAVRNKF